MKKNNIYLKLTIFKIFKHFLKTFIILSKYYFT